MLAKKLNNFKVIRVTFSKDGSSYHELFVKEHSLKQQDDDKPPGRTLCVLNIPPYANELCINKLFSQFGKVITVKLQKGLNEKSESGNGFKSGYLVFSNRSSLLKSLEISTLHMDLPIKTGLSKWIEQYNNSITDPEKLRAEINNFMKKHDKLEHKTKSTEQKQVDGGGWTVVTKKGRNPGITRKESVEIKLNEKIKASSKKKELKNFYTFQIKESKMKNIVELRKNFEEAKKKVALMKASRRFKPY